ncbi:hypothetical protein [Eudoraea chungangensis]|uniref:hypothetical protein n=1 Tax=Eudoraea chungangensis TaxID=1481905 RepID=UPI0023EE28D9|nr:hypothetical protein [Eudoraea chungangensis]
MIKEKSPGMAVIVGIGVGTALSIVINKIPLGVAVGAGIGVAIIAGLISFTKDKKLFPAIG